MNLTIQPTIFEASKPRKARKIVEVRISNASLKLRWSSSMIRIETENKTKKKVPKTNPAQ
jgi:hypothetical protein